MPGIVGAFGCAVEGERLARAARLLCRRPWDEPSTVAHGADGIFLAVAGERVGVAAEPLTGVVAVVDGELFEERPVAGDAAAARLLRRYLRDGAATRAPDGWFAAALWDPRPRTLVLVADDVGQRPLYVARHGGGTIFASELKALVALGLQPQLDLQAWAELLAYEHALGDGTPLEGARLVPPGSFLVVREDGGSEVNERWRYVQEAAERADEGEALDEFARLLHRAVERRLDWTTALALSGGLDSRAIATVVATAPAPPAAASYGAPGSQDLVISTRVAERLGLRHVALPLNRGYIAAGAAETVWLAEGQVRCFHAHHLVLRSLREAEGIRALLIGFAGDPMMRDYRGVPPGPRRRSRTTYTASVPRASRTRRWRTSSRPSSPPACEGARARPSRGSSQRSPATGSPVCGSSSGGTTSDARSCPERCSSATTSHRGTRSPTAS